ncbi:CE126 protein, partial [Trogon melanurus]|nr:CE126 protein [Trogon melanurus]
DRTLTLHFEHDLEEERRALKEDQKICRSRARKYLIETNRRRRAFEVRRKQEEEKELRLREQILQQRKMKLQEATNKFQRVHLPFAQHRQIVQTKAAFQLEEALEQIKGSVLTPGLCLPSRNKTNFRTTDDSSSSSASRNSSFHKKQISGVVDWDKTMEESRTNMDSYKLLFQKNPKEMQQLLEKQHLSNLENFHQEVKKADDSDSLSSLDSLEAGEQNGNCTTQNESSLTSECDCVLYNPEKSQTRNNGLLYIPQNTSKNMHLNNRLRNVDSQYYRNLPAPDLLAEHNVLTPAEHVNNSEEGSSASQRSGNKTAGFSTSGKQESSGSNAFSFLQNIKEERRKPPSGMTSTSAAGHPVFNPSKTWASPDSSPGERVQDLMQDQSFKVTPQKRAVSVQTPSQPIATSIISFPNQGCSTGIPSTADTLPKDKNTSTEFLKNTSGKTTETKKENIKCVDDSDYINPGSSLFQDIPNASVLCDVKQQNNTEGEKGDMVKTVSLVSDIEFSSGTCAQHKPLKNSNLERKKAKLFVSILKKDSKYEPSHFKAVVMNHGISFGTRPMSSIRDSVELAKIKKKSAENEKYNRKLRWCDQINQIIIENEKCHEKNTSEISSAQLQYVQTTNNAPKTNLSIFAQPSNPMFLKNHQENPHISKPNVNTEESNKECMSLNIFMSTGSSSAKKAWMVSKHEESKHTLCGNNSKFSEGNLLKNKVKITRRTRAQLGFMPRKRAGSITLPQLATEANKSEKAPGMLLAPHPPSAPLLGHRSGENTGPGCRPLVPSSLQATTASRSDFNGRHVTLADWVLNRTRTESSGSVTCRSDLATAIPTPGCSTGRYEPWAKNTCSVRGVQTSACQDHSVTCAEKRPVNVENGLHLHHIPAAGKTSSSWRGTRTARAPKGSATGKSQHHVSHYSNSHITKRQRVKANVSHVITDGSSQITSFKVASRMNELFSFSANNNSAVPVTRQKEVFDNHENKHRAFSEHRRQSVASKRWKPTHHTQLSPVQSAFDPVQNMNNTYKSDEVSESTVQFLMAEKLASTPIAEDEILAALENVQPARQALLLNRAPCPGMSTLSVEEQKIFQCLDGLNRRLQS